MLLHDIQRACRRLTADLRVNVIAVTLLAIAIGLSSAMFGVTDALFLRPAPFDRPDELASVYMADQHGGRLSVDPAVLRAWHDSDAFARVEAATTETVLLQAEGVLATRSTAHVTPGVFDMLGVRPIRGRLFAAGDVDTGADTPLLVSEELWRTILKSDPDILGRRLTVGTESGQVIGVLPADFRFPLTETRVWQPIDVARARERTIAYVRFDPRMTREAALRRATAAARAADQSTASQHATARGLVTPNKYDARTVTLLMVGSAVVFLALCLNVSGLLMTRFSSRRRDCAIAMALGASRGRLMREALVESGIVVAVGFVCGLGLAWVLLDAARNLIPDVYLSRTLNPLGFRLPSLVAGASTALAATLLVGAAPAWVASRTQIVRSLRVVGPTGSSSRTGRAIASALLIVQVALACALLVPALLLVRSFANLTRVDRGLDVAGVITAPLLLPKDAFPDVPSRAAVSRLVTDRLRQMLGVRHVSWSYGVPPEGAAISFGRWRGDGGGEAELSVDRYAVADEFLDIYRIPLLRGRGLASSDSDEDVIISAQLARRVWPEADALGRRLTFGTEHFTVIGIVKELRYPSVDSSLERPQIYSRLLSPGRSAIISLRADRGAIDTDRVRQVILATHPAIRVGDVRRPEDLYLAQLAPPRAAAALATLFAIVVLLTTGAGLYCSLTLSVTRRYREFGIRIAVGAPLCSIRWLVLRDCMLVLTAGLGLGVAAAAGLARASKLLHYGVTTTDPMTWSAALSVLTFAGLAACWWPSRLATRADPQMLMHEDSR